ncbi:MAG: RagB/SusD family nutrient uptake outer membrane protein [Chitinophagaceae bacterium]
MKSSVLKLFIIAGLLLAGVSCTKLDESGYIYDRVTGAQFGKTDLEISSSVGAAYSNLSGMASNNHYLTMNEVTTDECVVPTRGPDWGDGGRWIRLKQHIYKADDPDPLNGWTFCYKGVSTCNRLIATLTTFGTPAALDYIPELKALRAIYYYWLLDWYGNVPLSIDFNDTKPPTNATKQQVFDFIEAELVANAPLLKKPSSIPDIATQYRVNYYTAQACLAKLYLNAQVYTGTPQWDKAIAACNTIINSGIFVLTPTYVENFIQNNQFSKETIWSIPYDHVKFTGSNINMMTLSYLNQQTYNINDQPWNGFATTAEFYNSYIDPTLNPGPQGRVVGLTPLGDSVTATVDKRMQANFLVGPQFDASGKRLIGNPEPTDPDGAPFTFTPYINELEPNAWRQAGARISKWQFYQNMTSSMDNDFAIFRYADILLTKAEATARKANNWNDPTVAAVVNQIRTQHGGVTAFTNITAANFLAERGREMFFESWRRQDMIRFGTYNNAFQFHPADGDSHVNIFPLPTSQLDANKNLKQNPGYQ